MKLRLIVVATSSIVVALLIGVPTGIINTPWYTRMTPVLWWNYPVWAASSILTGLLLGTYVRPPAAMRAQAHAGKSLAGGLLAAFAVGCPICNKLVVMAIGVSGALNWFAPAQPVLAIGSLTLLAYAVRARIRALSACTVPSVPLGS